MGVMSAADMMALAKKLTPKNTNGGHDPTTKLSHQQRSQRRAQQQRAPKSEPKEEPKLEPKVEEDSEASLGPYVDYTIYSKASDGAAYSLMRFKPPNRDASAVDLFNMAQPIRINRKQPKAKLPPGAEGDIDLDPLAIKEPKWKPLRGPDGREIIGKDGKVVLGATVDGREILQANWGREREKLTKAELEARKKKAPFKKKTRQIFQANPGSRSDYQERLPWVLESADEQHSWTGRQQNFDDGSAYGILIGTPTADGLYFVPLSKRYEFVQTKTHAASKTAEAAEAELADVMKRGSLLYQLNRRAPQGSMSAAALATIEGGGPGPSGSGPSRVKKEEDEGGNGGLFGSDEEDTKSGVKEDAGSMDEMEYEEEHADDEDNVEPEEMEDDEAKAAKARIKREHIAANKTRDGGVDDDDDDDSDDAGALTREGRRMKRALKRQDNTYDSDSDSARNPYASSEEDEEDDFLFGPSQAQSQTPSQSQSTATPSTPTGPAATPVNRSRAGTPKPRASSNDPASLSTKKESSKKDLAGGSKLKTSSVVGSRASSPAPVSGAAIVAQRATSPAPSKKSGSKHGVRASSPLAGGASRAASPVRDSGHAGSPLAASAASSKGKARAMSPAQGASGTAAPSPAPSPLKRKAPDDGQAIARSNSATNSNASSSSSLPPTKKKLKKSNGLSANGEPASFPGSIAEHEVVNVLRAHPQGVLSGELIGLFKEHLTRDQRNKEVLKSIVKRVATSVPVPKGFLLSLKPGL